jgi:hypothetical protein
MPLRLQWWTTTSVGVWLLFNILFNYFLCVLTPPVSIGSVLSTHASTSVLTCLRELAVYAPLQPLSPLHATRTVVLNHSYAYVRRKQGQPSPSYRGGSAVAAASSLGRLEADSDPRNGGEFSTFCKRCTCNAVAVAAAVALLSAVFVPLLLRRFSSSCVVVRCFSP